MDEVAPEPESNSDNKSQHSVSLNEATSQPQSQPSNSNEDNLRDGPIGRFYKCTLCCYRTSMPGDFSGHVSRVHRMGTQNCKFCQFMTTSGKNLISHLKRVHLGPAHWYFCGYCLYRSKSKANADFHKREAHKDLVNDTCFCDLCPFEASQVEDLERHKRALHSGEGSGQVKKQYQARRAIEKKLLKRPDKDEPESRDDVCVTQVPEVEFVDCNGLDPEEAVCETRKYECPMCYYKSFDKMSLKRHLLRKHNVPYKAEYRCETCSFETDHHSEFSTHRLAAHPGYRIMLHSCPFCPHVATNQERLDDHVRSAHPVPDQTTPTADPKTRSFLCKQCTYKTEHLELFEKHNRWHYYLNDASPQKRSKLFHVKGIVDLGPIEHHVDQWRGRLTKKGWRYKLNELEMQKGAAETAGVEVGTKMADGETQEEVEIVIADSSDDD